MKSPWRYPGGKSRLSGKIKALLPESLDGLVEPFVGGGGATFALLELVTPGAGVVLNDADPRVAAWWSVMTGPDDGFEEMVDRLGSFEPTVARFQSLQRNSLKSGRLVERAFAAMAINRCAYSGILDAGPIGGKEQRSEYDVGCRYNPDRLVKDHRSAREILSRYDVTVLNEDFRQVLSRPGFVYADPPYVVQGSKLYPTTFDGRDHDDLADLILSRESGWAVSYDDDPWVRERYAEHRIYDLSVIYSVNSVIKGPRARRSELLVLPAIRFTC